MFGPQGWYRNTPANIPYNPYLHSSYQRPASSEPIPTRSGRSIADEQSMQERARVLAEQRARRAQYLPDEDVDSEDEWEYNQLGPRQQAYLEAKRRQGILERRRQEEELQRQRFLEEQKDLERKRREAQEQRQKLLEERQRELKLKREEDDRQRREQEIGASQPSLRIPIHSHPQQQSTPPSSPSATEQGAAEPEAQPTSTHTPEELNEAAARIQRQFRIFQSSRALDDIATEFEKRKKEFVYPSVIDVQAPGDRGSHIAVPACRPPSDFDNLGDETAMEVDGSEGKLSYTSTNYALNAYSDGLDKILMKLDGVESWGEDRIRMKRRGIVKDVEKEAARIEWYWKQAWLDHVATETTVEDPSSWELI